MMKDIAVSAGATYVVTNKDGDEKTEEDLAAITEVQDGWTWKIIVTSQDGEHKTYYTVNFAEPEAAYTATIANVYVSYAGNKDVDGAVVTGVKSGMTFDNNADLSFTAEAKPGYRITKVVYSITDGAGAITIKPKDGVYTIAAKDLSGVSDTKTMNIRIYVAADPKVTFTADVFNEDGELTKSESVVYGGTIVFEVQSENLNVSIDGTKGTDYENATRADDGKTWTITGVKTNLTVTISSTVGGN